MSDSSKDINEEFFLAVKKGNFGKLVDLKARGAQIGCPRLAEKNYTPLHAACENGFVEIVGFLLKYDADPNCEADQNITPLHLAAQNGHWKVADVLLRSGACMNARTEKGSTPLLLAVERGHPEVVLMLLKVGSSVNTKDNENNSPLYSVVESDKWSLVQSILEYKPDIDVKTNKAILRSIKLGKDNPSIVSYMMRYGFTVDQEDVNDLELLHAAVEKSYLKIVERLSENGADLNNESFDFPLLCHTVKHMDLEMTQLLLKFGCDVNSEDKQGCTPICYSFSKKDPKNDEIFLLLKAKGADIKKALNSYQMFQRAVECECFEACKILIEFGADVNAVNRAGHPPLHTIISADGGVNETIMKLLLENGADPNFKTLGLPTALHLAVSKGNKKAICNLLNFHADVNMQSKDSAPLHQACENNCIEIAEILLENDADANMVLNGLTPLRIAINKKSIEMVKILLKYDVDINEENIIGQTVIGFAISKVPPNLSFNWPIHNRPGFHRHPDDHWYGRPGNHNLDLGFYNPKSYSFEKDIAETLKYHAIKLNVAGLYVSDKNLLHVNANSQQKFDCEIEVSKMKAQQVCQNVTVFGILANRNNSVYARKKYLIKMLELIDYSEFPLYESLLKSSFENIKKISELLTPAQVSLDILARTSNVFNEERSPTLPTETLDEIVSYLDKKSLKTLISCGENLKKQVSAKGTVSHFGIDNIVM